MPRNLLAEGNNAARGVEQQNDDERDGEKPYGMSQRREYQSPNKHERSHPCGLTPLVCHAVRRLAPHLVQRLVRHLVQRLARRHRIHESGRRSGGKFDCFGNLTKALAFSPECAARVAKCRVSEHAGLIHALDAGYDFRAQQQSTLFDQLGNLREAQAGIAEGLRSPVLGGLRLVGILGIHLLHGLFQERHVIDHRKSAPATVAAMVRLFRRRGSANARARTFSGCCRFCDSETEPSAAAASTLVIGNCAACIVTGTIPGNDE